MKNLSFNLISISLLWPIVSIFNHQVSAEISLAKGYRATCSDKDACSRFALEPLDNFGSFFASNQKDNAVNDQILKKRQLYVGSDRGSGEKPSEPFIFDITCSRPATTYYLYSVDFCKNAKAAFLKAASIFSSVLQISTPIKVQVDLVSFCRRSLPGCGTTLGIGKPTKVWQLTGLDNPPDLFYPQALAKQLIASLPYYMKDSIDIEIRLNLDFPYYFSEDILSQNGYGSSFHSIWRDEYDFSKLIMRVMLRGLGITSFFRTSLHDSQSTLSQLYPFLKDINLSETLSGHVNISDNKATFQLSIFDYTLHSTIDGTSLYSVMKNVEPIFDPSASPASQQAALDAARHLYKLATTRNAVISQYRNGRSIYPLRMTNILGSSTAKNGVVLYTAQFPFDISSLMHADKDLYEKTEEFLITSIFYSGLSLETEVKKYGGHFGALGKRTLAILSKLGYRLQASVSPVLDSLLSNDGSSITFSLCFPAVLSLFMTFTL